MMDTLGQVATGISLAVACGCRLFVTLLVLGLASVMGLLPKGWFSSVPALVIFVLGTVIEVMAFYRPRLDNLMDAIALPSAVIAGGMVMTSLLDGLPPIGRWALGVIGGGGTTLIIQTATVLIRADLTTQTGGINNGTFATIELGTALGIALLVLLEPHITAIGVLVLLGFACRYLHRYWQKRRQTNQSS